MRLTKFDTLGWENCGPEEDSPNLRCDGRGTSIDFHYSCGSRSICVCVELESAPRGKLEVC